MKKPKPLKNGRFLFLKKRLFWDSLATIISGIAAIVLGFYRFKNSRVEDQLLIEILFGLTIAFCICSLIRIVIDFKNEYHDDGEESLNAMLHILYSQLSGYRNKQHSGDPQLRICVYVPDGTGHLQQRTEYVGTTETGKKGTRVCVSRGIIGKAYENKALTVDSLPRNRKFVDYMKVKYNFSIEQIRELRKDRQSWAALYLGDDTNCVAIIYCDSCLSGYFGNEYSFRWKVLYHSAVGMLRFFNQDTTINRS
ncbi:hypothetical protein [Gimesia sp.]|uniref:hypothetical protein n=1 Tax=Gimesia sp. TaxID=2024833 RepID=UPI000C500A1A|nr:hypothetical protein [Gimesia sp.]MAX40977.1 hypothetical protein [Gimesia sp.]HAH46847.1 hypothetical protein [Planctomycetaceae bacterium]HBL42742.1 hypothetical protein [Planctomycetaceae bacterium]|tara:strand:- start:4343 stop:5098 length:756 start_codon:yes stop_codon:yes gene_type:complete